MSFHLFEVNAAHEAFVVFLIFYTFYIFFFTSYFRTTDFERSTSIAKTSYVSMADDGVKGENNTYCIHKSVQSLKI